MKLTDRDLKLIRDVALSHLLSRDQATTLYFGSTARANARLRLLACEDFLKVLRTPFHTQHLYAAGPRAREVVGDRIASIISWRSPSPQFVQHALAVTDVRAAFIAAGCTSWRFEPQVRQEFVWQRSRYEVKPDGFLVRDSIPTFLEIDLGHVGPPKFIRKLQAYRAFELSGEFARTYHAPKFKMLAVTIGEHRRTRLLEAAMSVGFDISCLTFAELGVRTPGGWS